MISAETIERIKARMALAGLRESDLDERFLAGGGPGGQKVNKTSSAVQLRHTASGWVVKCSETRSRETNRWLARRELAERLLERIQSEDARRIQEAERIRRKKRRRSRRQQARMVEGKRRHGAVKAARARVSPDE